MISVSACSDLNMVVGWTAQSNRSGTLWVMDGDVCAKDLLTVMDVFGLRAEEVPAAVGMTVSEVERWARNDPPSDQAQKIRSVTKIAEILRFYLKDDRPAVVVRRPVARFGGRTMLEVIAADRYETLVSETEQMFDWSRMNGS